MLFHIALALLAAPHAIAMYLPNSSSDWESGRSFSHHNSGSYHHSRSAGSGRSDYIVEGQGSAYSGAGRMKFHPMSAESAGGDTTTSAALAATTNAEDNEAAVVWVTVTAGAAGITAAHNSAATTNAATTNAATTTAAATTAAATTAAAAAPVAATTAAQAATTNAASTQTASTIATTYQGLTNGAYQAPVTATNWQDAVLDAHNYYRAAHGLPDYTWSDEAAAALAAASPSSCPGDDLVVKLASGMSMGSNWAAAYGSGLVSTDLVAADASALVDTWYNETLAIPVAAWGLASGSQSDQENLESILEDKSAGGFTVSEVVGHFTQVVWAGSTEIACLYSNDCTTAEKRQLTCAYMNAGNVRGIDLNYVKNIPPRLDSGYAAYKAS